MPHCLRFDWQVAAFAYSLTRCSAGINNAINSAMMAITTKSSINVNPLRNPARNWGDFRIRLTCNGVKAPCESGTLLHCLCITMFFSSNLKMQASLKIIGVEHIVNCQKELKSLLSRVEIRPINAPVYNPICPIYPSAPIPNPYCPGETHWHSRGSHSRREVGARQAPWYACQSTYGT